MTQSHSGGCQCGAVRYRASTSGRAAVCHCRMCQKAHGAPLVGWLGVEVGQFEWTRGKPAEFRSSTQAVRTFCSNCGTPLTFKDDREASLDIATATLDEPRTAAPDRQYGMEGRMAWLDGFNELPGKEAGVVAGSYQHPDHDTKQWPREASP